MGRGRLLAVLALCVAVSAQAADGAAAARALHVRHAHAAAAPAVVPGKLIVGFRAGVSDRAQQRALERAGADRLRRLGSNRVRLAAVAPRAARRAIDLLEGDSRVRYVEPDRVISLDALAPAPDDPQFAGQWGLENTGQPVGFTPGTPGADIGARGAWAVSHGSSQVTVGIVDTGIDLSHPDLAANLWVNPGENCAGCRNDGVDNDGNGYVDDWRGWDFANGDNDPMRRQRTRHARGRDRRARSAQRVGVAGVSWNLRLMPLKFIGADGTGDVAGAVLAIRYASAMGARITNNSWGDDEYSQALADAIAEAGAHGDLFVAAAGNESSNNDGSPRYPAGYDLPNDPVAAERRHDRLASFSNYGRAGSTWPRPGSDPVDLAGCRIPVAERHLDGLAVRGRHRGAGTGPAPGRDAGDAAGAAGGHRRPSAGAGRRHRQLGPAGCRVGARLRRHPAGGDRRARAGIPGGARPAAGRAPAGRRLRPASGVTVTAAGNGQPITLTSDGAGTYSGTFTPAASGPATITATATTAGATASASASGTVPAAIAVDGAAVTVTSAAGEDAQLVFDAPAGTRLSAVLTASTIPVSIVTVREPDGSAASSAVTGTGNGFLDAFTLTQPGVHTIVVHPYSGGGGSTTVRLLGVPPDASAVIVPGGQPQTLAVTVPGQNAVATFSGAAGRRVALGFTSTVSFLRTTLLRPDGTVLAGPLYTSGSGFLDTVRLPLDGTYTLLFDPQDTRTGSVAATLYDVPEDVAASAQPGAGAVSATVTATGQNAVFSFSATAGRRISLGLTTNVSLLKTTILNPDGTTLSGPSYTGPGSSFVDARTLPQTGSYRIVADPQDVRTGTVTATVYDVPADAGAAITVGGPAVTLTTTVPGQNAAATFTGVAGRAVSLVYTTAGLATVNVSLLAPDGSVVARGAGGLDRPGDAPGRRPVHDCGRSAGARGGQRQPAAERRAARPDRLAGAWRCALDVGDGAQPERPDRFHGHRRGQVQPGRGGHRAARHSARRAGRRTARWRPPSRCPPAAASWTCTRCR